MANRDLNATITVVDAEKVLAAMAGLPKQVKSDLRRDMGREVRPTAAAIKNTVPSDGQTVLSGMVHAGRTRWSPVKATVKFHAKPRRGGYGYKPLLQIDVTGTNGLGFDYSELAGASTRAPRAETKEFTRNTRNGQTVAYRRVNNHGDQFIQSLKKRFPPSKAGRFAFRKFIQSKPELEAKTLKIMETYAAKVNRKIRSY